MSGDQQLAIRLAHTLKCVAGNIGAIGLYNLSREVENAIRQNGTAETEEYLADLASQLKPILTSLEKISSQPAEPAVAKESVDVESPEVLLEVLKEMEPHLKKEAPGNCVLTLKKLKCKCCPRQLKADMDERQKKTPPVNSNKGRL
ncbi:MAG: Hpt domain-containing protein [Candidatus Eremiobacteraeota bacterium]|nr:Hpt domain-containing protein [Candidatus Eremiobacteraeota bacterium]